MRDEGHILFMFDDGLPLIVAVIRISIFVATEKLIKQLIVKWQRTNFLVCCVCDKVYDEQLVSKFHRFLFRI